MSTLTTTGQYQPGLSFRRYAELGQGEKILTVNASLLKEPTPLHVKATMDDTSDSTSPALALGDAFHKAVLEPESFDNDFDDFYLMSPTKGLDTKRAAEARALNPDHIIVNQEIIDKVKWMRDAIYRHHAIAAMLGECNHRELSGVAPDPDKGVVRKIRVDACVGVGEPGEVWAPYLLDIKTTRSMASAFDFKREVMNYNYDLQAAFYLDTDALITGRKREAFLFAAVSNSAPYCARLFMASPEMIERGRERYQHRLAAIAQAALENHWCAWEHEQEPVVLFP